MEISKDSEYQIYTSEGDLYYVPGVCLDISDGFVAFRSSLKWSAIYYNDKRLDAFTVVKDYYIFPASKIRYIAMVPKGFLPNWLTNRTKQKAKAIMDRYKRIVKRHKCIPTIRRKLGIGK